MGGRMKGGKKECPIPLVRKWEEIGGRGVFYLGERPPSGDQGL